MHKKEDETRLLFLSQFLYKFLTVKNNTHGGTYRRKLADVFIKRRNGYEKEVVWDRDDSHDGLFVFDRCVCC